MTAQVAPCVLSRVPIRSQQKRANEQTGTPKKTCVCSTNELSCSAMQSAEGTVMQFGTCSHGLSNFALDCTYTHIQMHAQRCLRERGRTPPPPKEKKINFRKQQTQNALNVLNRVSASQCRCMNYFPPCSIPHEQVSQ